MAYTKRTHTSYTSGTRPAPAGSATLVTVPIDAALASEPATTIAKARHVWTSLVALLALTAWALPADVIGAGDTFVQAAAGLAVIVWAYYNTWKQGRQTRAAVYSPEAAAAIAETPVGEVQVVPGSPTDAVLPHPPGSAHR